VRGITTAATIWASAAVGMAIGRELYLAAGLGALLIFIILEARPFTRRVDDLIRRIAGELREELQSVGPFPDDPAQIRPKQESEEREPPSERER
jgi:uncharacterized membrane protein YhiD involved in acid resistance